MYPFKDGSDGEQSWTGGFGVGDDDTIVVSCGDGRVSLVATRTTNAGYLPDERFSSGWEITCRERRNEIVVTHQFGLVDTRQSAVQFLNDCRGAINQAIQRRGPIDSTVVSSIVDKLATDCDVPIVRPPEGTHNGRDMMNY